MLDLIAADKEIVRRHGFRGFVEVAWSRVPTAGDLIPNWHITEICKELELVSLGRSRRVVFNVPPGTGKSMLTCVLWPVWEWIDRPKTSFCFASYDPGLVGRDADRSLELLRSQWFIDRWGRKLPSRGVVPTYSIENAYGGYRYGTSIGGALTGRHFDIRVCDDPIKPKDAAGGLNQSRAALQACEDWHRHTWSTRIRDPQTAREVLIMQRLNEDDLAGVLLRTDRYRHISFPMRYDPERSRGNDPRTTRGELLFPARYPEEEVQNLEIDLGPEAAAAQLQQDPMVSGGTVWRAEFFRRFWHPTYRGPVELKIGETTIQGQCEALPDSGFQMQSWDCSFKGLAVSDNVAGGVFQSSRDSFYLIDWIESKRDFLATLDAIRLLSERYPKSRRQIAIEDKANGTAAQNTLVREYPTCIPVEPLGSKVARAQAVTPPLNANKLVLPHPELIQIEGKPLVPGFLKTALRFPHVRKDDSIDMVSQALIILWKGLEKYRGDLQRWKRNHG